RRCLVAPEGSAGLRDRCLVKPLTNQPTNQIFFPLEWLLSQEVLPLEARPSEECGENPRSSTVRCAVEICTQ
ncbi:unnamed protein product, partial [Vitrella brassicaformis CCMP3155]